MDFDFNRAFDTAVNALGRYWDGELFRDNPQAAAAFFATQAGGNTNSAYPHQSGQTTTQVPMQLGQLLPVLLIGGAVVAVVLIAR